MSAPTLFINGLKSCSKCKISKPPEGFHKASRAASGYSSWCKSCRDQYQRDNPDIIRKNKMAYKERNKAEIEAKRKKRHQKDPLRRRSSYVKKQYGLSQEEYLKMIEGQGNVCAICGLPESIVVRGSPAHLAVDHDHTTGKVRALLCRRCNHVIGHSNESIELLKKMIEYIEKHRGDSAVRLA